MCKEGLKKREDGGQIKALVEEEVAVKRRHLTSVTFRYISQKGHHMMNVVYKVVLASRPLTPPNPTFFLCHTAVVTEA